MNPPMTPQEIDAHLAQLQPADQDAFLSNLPTEALDAYAKFSNDLRQPTGEAHTQIGGHPVIRPEDMEHASDEDLLKIATMEGLDPNTGLPSDMDVGQKPQGDGGKSFIMDSGRGMAVRGLVHGATAIPSMLFDAVTGNPGETRGAIDSLMDMGRIPRATEGPDGRSERLVQAGFEGLGGFGATGGAAMGLEALGAKGIPALMKSEPTLQAGSNVLGSVAGQNVAENGGSAKEQILTALLAGAAPGALKTGLGAATRGAMRGHSPDAVREVVDTFKTGGAVPTVGQATQGEKAQAVEGFLSQLFGSSGTVRKRVAGQEADIGQNISDRAAKLDPVTSTKGPVPPTTLQSNEAMGTKISNDAENIFMPNSRKIIDQKYENFYKQVPGTTIVPVGKVGTLLDELTSVIPGAESLSSNKMINPDRGDFVGLLVDLKKDIKKNGGAGLPLDAVKNVRSKIGGLIEKATFDSDKPTAELKRLYGALSETMKDAAGPVGSASRKAFDDANSATQQYHAVLDMVKPVLERNGGPEKVFTSALAGTKDGGSVIRNVYSVLSPDGRKAMTAAILRRAAKTAGGDPEDFDMQRFARNYGNMDKEAKKVVFGAMGGNYESDLDKIAKAIKTIGKEKEEYGLATSAAQGRIGVQAAIQAPIYALAAGLSGAATSHPVLGAAAGAAIPAGFVLARKTAKWMMNPKTVHFLAETTKLPKEQIPIAINNFANAANDANDPEMKELAEYLKSNMEEDNAL